MIKKSYCIIYHRRDLLSTVIHGLKGETRVSEIRVRVSNKFIQFRAVFDSSSFLIMDPRRVLKPAEFEVRQLLENQDKGHVIATCRNPNGALSLQELKNKFPERLNILQLDVTDESTIEASAKSVQERYCSLNLLINVTGVLSLPGVLQPVQKQR